MSMDIPQAVVDGAREGDMDALSELVRRSQSEVYTLALRLTGNEEDAQDVVQDAYIRVMKGIRRFRGDSSVSTWLYRVTANTAYTFLQRRNKQRTQPLSEVEDVIALPEAGGAGPDDAVVTAELRDRLQDAVAELPPSYRSVVVLKDIYGLPHEEIASSLGISETACKVRLFRARRRLREALFDDHDKERLTG
jgi:RNA polymerase sigma-70 factor (ECF subfamily)